MGKTSLLTTFHKATSEAFGFLSEDLSYAGPFSSIDAIEFVSEANVIRIGYNEREGYVATKIITSTADGLKSRAGLTCLYVGFGLGPAQDIRKSAHNHRQLVAVAESQARALRKALAMLPTPSGAAMLQQCHGRL